MAKKSSKKRSQALLWSKRYKKFKANYYQQEKLVNEKGFSTYIQREGQPILTKTEFKEKYIALLNDRKKEIALGKRKTVGNLEKALSSMQVYEHSEDKAYAILNFLKTHKDTDEFELDYSTRNINELLMKIRTGEWLESEVGLWEAIKKERADLFKQGMSKGRVRAEISITVFGSDPDKFKNVV